MRVGIPTEIKNNEYRVAITPAGVAELVHRGHEVIIQSGAGEGSAITDADFKRAGAQLITSAEQVWEEADLLLKVKEPIETEYGRMRKGQTVFTYLHLAASRPAQATAQHSPIVTTRPSAPRSSTPPTRCGPRPICS